MRGLEPPRLAAPDPKSGVYTNFTTSACDYLKSGGPSEIRTLGGITLAGFQDQCIRPTLPKIHMLFL